MNWKKGRKIFRIIWILFGISFFLWMILSMSARGVDKDFLESSSSVFVEQTDNFISFTPNSSYQKVLIFYPGALVDPDAYAPLCRKIAENGYQALIIRMPWRLATKGYHKIKKMDFLNDPAKKFILAGHSQGGKMAAQFVFENPGLIDQLILLGTTHPRDIDLSSSEIPVMKLYGSNDGVASVEKVLANQSRLPQTAKFIEIEGGNHSQFGYYGFQLGDSRADITREEQQEIILREILEFTRSQ